MNDLVNDLSATRPDAPHQAAPLDFGRPHRRIPCGSDEIAYWRAGAGPDVVLVHGWPLSAATWRELVPALATHFTCHLFDLPGAGLTQSPAPTPLSIADHVRTLVELVERLGLERCAFVAHDSGAVITRVAAAALGERVWANVMGNSEIPGHRPWQVLAYGLLHRLGGAALFSALLRQRAIRRSALAFGGCFHDKRHLDGPFHALFVEPLLRSRDAARGQLRLLAGFDWADVERLDAVHRQIHGPVQLIWGPGDPFFPLAKARELRFPGGTELHVIPHTKLFVHEEAPLAFANHASRFLRQHAQRP